MFKPILPSLLACNNNEATLHGQGDTDDLTISESTPPNLAVCEGFAFSFDFANEDPNATVWAGFSPTYLDTGNPLAGCLSSIESKNNNANSFAEDEIYKQASLEDLLDCQVSLTVFVEYEYDPETHYQRICLWMTVGPQYVSGFEESTEVVATFPISSFVVDVTKSSDPSQSDNTTYEFYQGPYRANSTKYQTDMVNYMLYAGWDSTNQSPIDPDFLFLNPDSSNPDFEGEPYWENSPNYSTYYTPIFTDQYFNQVYDAINQFAPEGFDPNRAGVQHFIIS